MAPMVEIFVIHVNCINHINDFVYVFSLPGSPSVVLHLPGAVLVVGEAVRAGRPVVQVARHDQGFAQAQHIAGGGKQLRGVGAAQRDPAVVE